MYTQSRKGWFGFALVALLLAIASFTPAALAQGASLTELVDIPSDCEPTQPEGWTTYVVQEGDMLSDIAARSGSTVEELLLPNCITDPSMIVVGSTLYVPNEVVPPDDGDDGDVDNVDDGEIDNVDDGEVDNNDDGEVNNNDEGDINNEGGDEDGGDSV